jgi:hypothetical protein
LVSKDDPRIEPVRILRDMAVMFIANECPFKKPVTECQRRLLGSNLMEWVVSWKSDGDGNIEAIELLHEMSMSGVNRNLNILFAK